MAVAFRWAVIVLAALLALTVLLVLVTGIGWGSSGSVG